MPNEGNKAESKEKQPRVYVRTFGCQMNDRDSEIVSGMLAEKGYGFVDKPQEADVVLFNTCSVRENAENRVWGQVAALNPRKPHTAHRTPIIGIIGCMAKIHGENIFEKLPHVDFICAPANIYEIPNLIERSQKGEDRISAIDKQARPLSYKDEIASFDYAQDKSSALRPPRNGNLDSRLCAYVNIMEGCDNFCSYCVVPYARGRERSRPQQEILDEVRGLIDNGVKDMTLLGQNVNSYSSGEGKDFIKLLEEIDKVVGGRNIRIRFVTSHPKDASEDLFKAMRDINSVCEYLHLPFQSGSDKILSLMNRKYTRKDYLKLIDKLKKILPECAISTDVIVGFPKETEEDFKDTVDLFKKVEFDSAFVFKYSPRPHTVALKYEDDVPKKIKEERNQILLKLQDEISLKKNKALKGEVVEALFEKTKKDEVSGRSRTNKTVICQGKKDLIGNFVNVKINKVTPRALIGEIDEE